MGNKYIENLKNEYNELLEVKRMIESEAFQKYIVKPMSEEQEILKYAYDCDTLKQLFTLKGKGQIIKKFFNNLKGVNQSIKMKKQELDNLDKE